MKYYGSIGFSVTKENPPESGIWTETIVERKYCGDILRLSKSLQGNDQVNDDISISNEISILSDPFANENYFSMKYLEFRGAKWKIRNIEIQYPRLLLTLGGLYNG